MITMGFSELAVPTVLEKLLTELPAVLDELLIVEELSEDTMLLSKLLFTLELSPNISEPPSRQPLSNTEQHNINSAGKPRFISFTF